MIKVNPMFPVKTFSNVIDEIFNRSFSEFSGSFNTLTTPSVNIREESDAFCVEVAAPGLEKTDFNIAVENDHLVIEALRSKETEESDEGKWTRKEFNFRSFKRSFYIPDTLNTEDISAEYDRGILTVRMAKKEEVKEKASRTIEIK
jgi:HSP20 family protein